MTKIFFSELEPNSLYYGNDSFYFTLPNYSFSVYGDELRIENYLAMRKNCDYFIHRLYVNPYSKKYDFDEDFFLTKFIEPLPINKKLIKNDVFKLKGEMLKYFNCGTSQLLIDQYQTYNIGLENYTVVKFYDISSKQTHTTLLSKRQIYKKDLYEKI